MKSSAWNVPDNGQYGNIACDSIGLYLTRRWHFGSDFKGQNVTLSVYYSDLLSKVHRLSSYSCIFWTFWWSVEFCEKQSKLSNTESKTDVLITTIGQKTRKTREPISTGNSNKYRQLIGPSEKTKKIVKNSRTKCFRGKKWVRSQIMDQTLKIQ